MMFLALTLRHSGFMNCLLNHQRLKYVNYNVNILKYVNFKIILLFFEIGNSWMISFSKSINIWAVYTNSKEKNI